MKKLLFLTILLSSPFFLNGMQSIKAFIDCGLGLSYRCGPIAKMPSNKFDGIPWSVQSKIVKNMFLLTLDDNKCTYKCTCDNDHDCMRCLMHQGNASFCKIFRLKCFDKEKLEKHTLINIPLGLGLQYIEEFLDIVHRHQYLILGRKFDLKEIYSIPSQHRPIVFTAQSNWVFFKGYTREEYKILKKIPVLKGRQLEIMPKGYRRVIWNRVQAIAVACTLCAVPVTVLAMKISPTISWMSFTVFFVGSATGSMNVLLLKKCRDYDPESWELKKVIL